MDLYLFPWISIDSYGFLWIYMDSENAPAQNALPPPRMQSTRPECNFITEFVLNPGHKFHPGILDT